MLQLSKYTLTEMANVLAIQLRNEGALRLYSGAQPDITVRTDGRLVSCPISEVTIDGGTLTIKWESGTAIKEGSADYFRLCNKNIPVLSGSIPEEMSMTDRALKVGTIVDAGMLIHTVFKV